LRKYLDKFYKKLNENEVMFFLKPKDYYLAELKGLELILNDEKNLDEKN
jgi:hypothetical protein